jgi:hypothetical protein
MNIENIWQQFSKRQFTYLTDIVSHSNAKTVCEIGAFCGSVARAVWKGIKHSDKELFLIDNYEFLPDKFRPHFFKLVKKTISDDARIHTILEDSHTYDWTKHEFVIFSHADFNHMKKDFDRLLDSDIKSVALDIPLGCFQRTATMLEAVKEKNLTPRYYVDGMLICGQQTHCSLPTEEGELLGHAVRYVKKKKGAYQTAIDQIVKNFNRA